MPPWCRAWQHHPSASTPAVRKPIHWLCLASRSLMCRLIVCTASALVPSSALNPPRLHRSCLRTSFPAASFLVALPRGAVECSRETCRGLFHCYPFSPRTSALWGRAFCRLPSCCCQFPAWCGAQRPSEQIKCLPHRSSWRCCAPTPKPQAQTSRGGARASFGK